LAIPGLAAGGVFGNGFGAGFGSGFLRIGPLKVVGFLAAVVAAGLFTTGFFATGFFTTGFLAGGFLRTGDIDGPPLTHRVWDCSRGQSLPRVPTTYRTAGPFPADSGPAPRVRYQYTPPVLRPQRTSFPRAAMLRQPEPAGWH